MNDILLLCLSLSLSGSLIALVLFLLKPFLSHFSKTWHYYIWLLVLFRLLFPISPDISLVGGLFQKAGLQLTPFNTTFENPQKSMQAVTSVPSNLFEFENAESRSPAATGTGFNLSIAGIHIWGTLWLATAIILLIRKLYGYGQFVKTVKGESRTILAGELPLLLKQITASMKIKKEISVCMNPLIRTPMLVGIIKPSVIIPSGLLHSDKLIYILRHELTHYRRMDFIYKWFTEIVVCLHWFNPFVYLIRKQINLECEFSCDEAVISSMETGKRQAYGETLLESIMINNSSHPKTIALSLNSDGKLIKERLYAIMKYKKKSKLVLILTAILTSFLFCSTVYAGAYSTKKAAATDTNTISGGTKQGNTTDVQRPQTAKATVQTETAQVQTVIYESVEMLKYDGYPELKIEGYPYAHDIRTNNTDKKITDTERGMLAFDSEGNPLMITWNGFDSECKPSYYYLYDWDDKEILPRITDDTFGGWTLNASGEDKNVSKIAYVLYCDKEITFEDGSKWINPDFEKWRTRYEGKKTAVSILDNYYPYIQNIQ